jgi:hypothetical protein
MVARPFDWRDLSALNRYRQTSVFLDSALLLTRGPMLVPTVLFSYLAPEMGVFTCVADGAMGQFIHGSGAQVAQLTFLAPVSALESRVTSTLLEYMMALACKQGALRLLADADEETQAFEALRKSGFAIFTRQRIWKLKIQPSTTKVSSSWRTAVSQDLIAIRSLYNNLAPGMVQQAEPYVVKRPRGMVYYQQGDLLGYVELRAGHRGIWVQPFIHPNTLEMPARLTELYRSISNRYSQPVYVCIRSFQSWLEVEIEKMGAQASPQQAVLVKHLAIAQKALRPLTLPALEGGQPEITAPVARSGSQ